MATAASIAEVQKAYVAYYGRPADPAGLEYWATRVDAEGGIDALVTEFGNSAEASARFGALSQSDAVDAIYQQIFGRAAEADGKSFYLSGLLSGQFTLVTLARDIIGGASGADLTTVSNKLSAAQQFTDALDTTEEQALYSGDNAATNARNWLDSVDSTEASVTSSVATIDSTISTLQGTPSNPGSSFSLTSAASDVLSGTSRDDTYDASTTAGTLQTGDSIVDPATDDADILNAATLAPSQAPKLTNVEVVNLSAKYVTGGLDLANVVGTETVNLSAGLASATLTVSGASTLAVSEILVSDSNVANARVISSASGTRDTVSIDFGAASGSLTGGAGVDQFSITIGGTKAVTLNTFDTSTDLITISNATGASSGTIVGAAVSAMASMVIAPSGSYTLNLSDDLGSGLEVLTAAGQEVTLNYSGSTTLLTRISINNSGAGTVTLDIGTYTANGTDNLGAALVDTILLSHSGSGAAGVTGELLINQASTLKIADQLGTAVTVGLGTGTAALTDDSGAVNITLTAQQGSATTALYAGSSVGTMNITNGTGATVVIAELQMLSSSATVMNFMGENAITVQNFSAGSASIVTAANMTAALSISSEGTLSVYGGSGNDTITHGGSAGSFYGMGGNDTITMNYSATSAFTVDGGDGNDIVLTGAGNDTVALGDGSDTLRINLATTGIDTVSDFVVGEDTVALFGAGTGVISVAAVSGTTAGKYSLVGGVAGGSVTLTGNTATDFTDSMQLGVSLNLPYVFIAGVTAVAVAGSKGDFIQITLSTAGGAYTLGDGSDTVEIVMQEFGAGAASAGYTNTLSDFVIGQDVLVLTGSADPTNSIDAFSADVATGVYTIGMSSDINLTYGGSNLSETDLSTSLRFGHSGSGADALVFSVSAGAVGLGDFNDFISLGSSAVVVTIKDDGGVDTIHAGSSLEVRYVLDGISLDLVTGQAANASKIANTIDGTTYVFADGEDGASTSSVDYSGRGSAGSAQLTGVATFLEANLGGTTGEKLLAVINDVSGDSAYTYIINNTEGAITADDLELITYFSFDSLGGDNIQKADLQA